MRTVFADSSYFLSLLNIRDEAHKAAHDFSENLVGKMVTTDWVLTEALTGDHHFEQAGYAILLHAE